VFYASLPHGWGACVFAPLSLKICNSLGMRHKKGGIYIFGKMRCGADGT